MKVIFNIYNVYLQGKFHPSLFKYNSKAFLMYTPPPYSVFGIWDWNLWNFVNWKMNILHVILNYQMNV